MDEVSWFNFELTYRGNSNEVRTVKWSQAENPLSLKDNQPITLLESETWTRNGDKMDNGQFKFLPQNQFNGLAVSSTAFLLLDAQSVKC